MAIERWDPFRELSRMREAMDRLWSEAFSDFPRFGHLFGASGLEPVMDIYQTPDHWVIKALVPGIRPEDLEVTTQDGLLTIKGELKQDEQVRDEDYILRERRYGTFTRTVRLPGNVEVNNAEAHYENGVLTLRIPKAEEAKPKRIQVSVGRMLEGART